LFGADARFIGEMVMVAKLVWYFNAAQTSARKIVSFALYSRFFSLEKDNVKFRYHHRHHHQHHHPGRWFPAVFVWKNEIFRQLC
jgi:hypothetical protein